MVTRTLRITGMHCASCEKLIAEDLSSIQVKAKIDVVKGSAEVTYDPSRVKEEQILATIKTSGYLGLPTTQ